MHFRPLSAQPLQGVGCYRMQCISYVTISIAISIVGWQWLEPIVHDRRVSKWGYGLSTLLMHAHPLPPLDTTQIRSKMG